MKIITSHELNEEIKKLPPREKMHFQNFPKLDDIFGGFYGGEIYTLGAFPGAGKTTFLISLTKDLAQTYPCMWFSCEMEPQSFMEMFGDDVPLFHLPKSIPTRAKSGERMMWLESMIMKAKKEYGTRIVMLDHLQYLTNVAVSSQVQVVDYVMRYLKEMVIRQDVALFLITHLKKETQDISRPSLDNLRGSQMIAGESFGVMFISRLKSKEQDEDGEHQWSNRSKVYVDKNRRGGKLGYVKVEYNFKEKMFYEL
ncbi:MAG: AAA family ATPase [Saprospiraceae bacterium]|nr:AAA family ATPase [Saprospiraceae bacterium]